MTPATTMIRDDAGAKALASARGVVVPPLYELIPSPLGMEARQMFMGWRVASVSKGADLGFVILFASVDGEDWEIMAEGGWGADVAARLFRFIFVAKGHARVSARCKATNARNVRALKRIGFVEEGRKRLPEGDVILFGMTRDECRLLNRRAA